MLTPPPKAPVLLQDQISAPTMFHDYMCAFERSCLRERAAVCRASMHRNTTRIPTPTHSLSRCRVFTTQCHHHIEINHRLPDEWCAYCNSPLFPMVCYAMRVTKAINRMFGMILSGIVVAVLCRHRKLDCTLAKRREQRANKGGNLFALH
jgi:hypothetical protein